MAAAKNLKEILQEIRERRCLDGSPWCPTRIWYRLETDLSYHGEWLGTGMRELVRLARLAALCAREERKNYTYSEFYYAVIICPRAKKFKDVILKHKDVITRSGDIDIEVDDEKVTFTRTGFAISYNQMVKVAILLDFLHSAIGYENMTILLEPVTSPDSTVSVSEELMDEIAREIRRQLNEILTATFGTQHAQRKNSAVRRFLQAETSEEEKQKEKHAILSPEEITDETIFQFWRKQAADSCDGEGVEGFKYFVSAAKAVFRYRQAMTDAQTEHDIQNASSMQTGQKDGSSLNLENEIYGENLYSDWRNPLVDLLRSPTNDVKWLTARDMTALRHYLGNPGKINPDELEEQGKPLPEQCYGLMGNRPYDLSFALTLLRADIFDPVQQKFKKSSKKLQKRVLCPWKRSVNLFLRWLKAAMRSNVTLISRSMRG